MNDALYKSTAFTFTIISIIILVALFSFQGGHPPGKPGKVREFDRKVREKSGKLWLACGVLLQLR